ncbi:MAG TPA: DinB family protein [Puia sp.]
MEDLLLESLNAAERKFAADYLDESKECLFSGIEGLSAEQLNFRAGPSEWSIAECIEHLSIAGDFGWQWMQGALGQPIDPGKKNGSWLSDGQVIQAMTDRTKKFKTLKMLEPVSPSPDSRSMLENFSSRRESVIAYVLTTKDNLKDRWVTHPLVGTIDLYQLLILEAAHSARHVAQIGAIKANLDFPKQ